MQHRLCQYFLTRSQEGSQYLELMQKSVYIMSVRMMQRADGQRKMCLCREALALRAGQWEAKRRMNLTKVL